MISDPEVAIAQWMLLSTCPACEAMKGKLGHYIGNGGVLNFIQNCQEAIKLSPKKLF